MNFLIFFTLILCNKVYLSFFKILKVIMLFIFPTIAHNLLNILHKLNYLYLYQIIIAINLDRKIFKFYHYSKLIMVNFIFIYFQIIFYIQFMKFTY